MRFIWLRNFLSGVGGAFWRGNRDEKDNGDGNSRRTVTRRSGNGAM
jgi:hypothetical protein